VVLIYGFIRVTGVNTNGLVRHNGLELVLILNVVLPIGIKLES